MNRWVDKDPDEVASYAVEWVDALATAETIASATWSASPSGLTFSAQAESGTRASVKVSGGTAGTDYKVLCRVTTSGGQTLDQSVLLRVRTK